MKIHREAEFAVEKVQTEMLNLWYGYLEIIKWIRASRKKKYKKKETVSSLKKFSSIFHFSLYGFHLIKTAQIIATQT